MKKIIYKIGFLTAICLFIQTQTLSAKDYEFSVKAGFNLGGTAPVSLPVEIRGINSYNPSLSLSLEGSVKRRLNDRWGVMTGLRFETKAMKTSAQVRNYSMALEDGGSLVEGLYTGKVITKVKNEYLTLPLLMVYNASKRWDLKMGAFFSYLMNGSFSGTVSDGYFRSEVPTNPKQEIDAAYDFSDNMRRFNGGVELGAEYTVFKHFAVYGDLTWSANTIFPNSFSTITFDMYNIYMNLGFAYLF